jgi:anthranilate phosphoribosyltransferase
MTLITQPNMHLTGTAVGDLHAGDEFYEALLDAHQGLSEEQSHALNARLILTLANHIGDVAVLKEAIKLAKDAS